MVGGRGQDENGGDGFISISSAGSIQKKIIYVVLNEATWIRTVVGF